MLLKVLQESASIKNYDSSRSKIEYGIGNRVPFIKLWKDFRLNMVSLTPQQSNLPNQIHSKEYKQLTLITYAVNFNNIFFPRYSQEWNNFSDDIKPLHSPISFKKTWLSFVKTPENSDFEIHDNNGIKLLSRLRLNLNEQNLN